VALDQGATLGQQERQRSFPSGDIGLGAQAANNRRIEHRLDSVARPVGSGWFGLPHRRQDSQNVRNANRGDILVIERGGQSKEPLPLAWGCRARLKRKHLRREHVFCEGSEGHTLRGDVPQLQ
jgi:hypothetical protein